jgi:SAM-dependent methyltransferase
MRSIARPRRLRLNPVSDDWGYDRGTPIDRHYIRQFLNARRSAIRGRVLEIKDSGYTDRLGSGVTSVDVLDVDATNPAATIVADLAAADVLADDAYDCVVLTQTLQYIPQLDAALAHVRRALAGGGSVLATVPSITRVTDEVPGLVDYWRFTEASARILFERAFGDGAVEVTSFGNALAACGFLLGLAAEELTDRELAVHDPRFPVVVAIHARKS